MKAALRLARAFTRLGIPWVLERPASSKAWMLPQIERMLRNPRIQKATGDFCQWGTKWRKRTSFLCDNLDPLEVQKLRRVCTGHGACSRTKKNHFQLTGSSPQGVPWTQIAQPYPLGLCRTLADVLTSSLYKRTA